MTVAGHLQSTTNPAVYAAGDSADTPGMPLTPVAVFEGKVAASNMLNGTTTVPDYAGFPTAVFTIPELVRVGLLEDEATAAGMNVDVRYGAWALGAVVLGLAGYVGYVLYPRFDLPAGAGAGLLVLATAAGVASFFSPCSFPLLVTMLAREQRRCRGPGPGHVAAGLRGGRAVRRPLPEGVVVDDHAQRPGEPGPAPPPRAAPGPGGR